MNLRGMAGKAKAALENSSDEDVEKASDAIQDHTPDSVDSKVDKGEEWAKKHNRDQ